ncbi:MAG TPA: glycosyltransferase [Chitinophagaceae bacterium]|nr:glycosyltransferase [Chitinophagaceae bacterium]
MGYRLLILKRWLEDVLIFPFVWLGRRKARQFPLDREYDIFFFFPFHHIGGAEKVHANIVNAFRGKKALIVFTRRSKQAGFIEEFKRSGHQVMDISALTDDKSRYWNNLYYRGVFSGYINAQKQKTVVFNGHSNFAYKMSRWIRHDIAQIELIHSFSSFSYIRLPFLPFYCETVMISRNRINDHLNQYRQWGVPLFYDTRIRYIVNGIELPEQKELRVFEENTLKMMYVGRGTPEKRVHLAGAIATELRKHKLPVQMSFIGDVAHELGSDNQAHDVWYGNVDDASVLHNLYVQRADILLITSSEEGFPMVVEEAMARGSIIMATPVGDLPVHIRQGVNGYLFSTVNDEQRIIEEAVVFVRQLLADAALCQTISANNIEYAYANFGLLNFEESYRSLIESHLQLRTYNPEPTNESSRLRHNNL